MATKHEMMQRMIHQYRHETGEKDIDMHKVVRFAVKRGWKLPKPDDPYDRLAKEFSTAAREEIRYDTATNRPYRVNHYFVIEQGDQQLRLWLDIDDQAPRFKMVKALGLRREQMIGDGLQLTLDADHWNSINPKEEPLKPDMDLTDEIQWRMNAPSEDKRAG